MYGGAPDPSWNEIDQTFINGATGLVRCLVPRGMPSGPDPFAACVSFPVGAPLQPVHEQPAEPQLRVGEQGRV